MNQKIEKTKDGWQITDVVAVFANEEDANLFFNAKYKTTDKQASEEMLFDYILEEKLKGVWVSGVEGNGEFKQWWPNGNLRVEYTQLYGSYHGVYRRYFENGNSEIEINYDKGLKHGNFIQWYTSGEPALHIVYENDKLVKTINSYPPYPLKSDDTHPTYSPT